MLKAINNLEFSQDRANVQSIEIYKPERAYYEGDISGFLKTNEPLAVLDSEHYTNFLDTLCTLDFEKEVVFLPIPMDGDMMANDHIIPKRNETTSRLRSQCIIILTPHRFCSIISPKM